MRSAIESRFANLGARYTFAGSWRREAQRNLLEVRRVWGLDVGRQYSGTFFALPFDRSGHMLQSAQRDLAKLDHAYWGFDAKRCKEKQYSGGAGGS
jgi:hypothetical protein